MRYDISIHCCCITLYVTWNLEYSSPGLCDRFTRHMHNRKRVGIQQLYLVFCWRICGHELFALRCKALESHGRHSSWIVYNILCRISYANTMTDKLDDVYYIWLSDGLHIFPNITKIVWSICSAIFQVVFICVPLSRGAPCPPIYFPTLSFTRTIRKTCAHNRMTGWNG